MMSFRRLRSASEEEGPRDGIEVAASDLSTVGIWELYYDGLNSVKFGLEVN